MDKFKVGDRVRTTEASGANYKKGWQGVVVGYGSRGCVVVNFNGKEECHVVTLNLKKTWGAMSKYEELKNRIEALDDGWNKEADDVLQEIPSKANSDYIGIEIRNDHNFEGHVTIRSGNGPIVLKKFIYHSQCEKNTAFKQALLWLLDNSDIAKEDTKKQKKYDALKRKMEELLEELETLK